MAQSVTQTSSVRPIKRQKTAVFFKSIHEFNLYGITYVTDTSSSQWALFLTFNNAFRINQWLFAYFWKMNWWNSHYRSVDCHLATSFKSVKETFVLERLFSVKYWSVRRSRCCRKFSSAWGRLKISRLPFHSCKIFEAHLINSLWFSKV